MNKELTQALRLISNWNSESISHIEKLADSITSTSYLIHKDQKKYVARLDKAFDQGVIPDRKNELNTLKFLNSNSLANRVVHSNLEYGILITEYIDANAWTHVDVDNANSFNRLANSLNHIHSLQPKLSKFDLRAGVSRYAKVLKTNESKNWSQQIISLLKQCEPKPLVLCHNDLHLGNILDNKDVIFIDWEYCGLGNPLFDVSSILQSLQLSDSQGEAFLKAYFGEPTYRELEDIGRFKLVHDLLSALWLSILIKSSESHGKEDLISIKQLELVKIQLNT